MPVDYRTFFESYKTAIGNEPTLYSLVLVGDQPNEGMSRLAGNVDHSKGELEVKDSDSLEGLARNLLFELKRFGSPNLVIKNKNHGEILMDGNEEFSLQQPLSEKEFSELYRILLENNWF